MNKVWVDQLTQLWQALKYFEEVCTQSLMDNKETSKMSCVKQLTALKKQI